jgi:DNA-binding MarR family transcriptional regulator
MPDVIQATHYIVAKYNNCIMQVLQSSTTKRFMHGFWNLRHKLIKDIGGKLHDSYGIDMAEMFLLQHVLERDVSPTDLSEMLQIPAHGISRKLENLQSLGLLERKLHPQDARKRVLTVTGRGKETLKNSLALMDSELQTILAVLDKASLKRFIGNLEKLAKVDSS